MVRSRRTPMEWLDTHAGSVQALATLVLVLLTAYYAWTSRALVRQTQISLQSNSRMALQGRLDRISELLIEHPRLSVSLDDLVAGDEDAGISDARSHIANMLWAVLEEAHTQYAVDRSMPEEDWRAWAATIEHFVGRRYLAEHWQRAGALYGDSFRQYVDERIEHTPVGAD